MSAGYNDWMITAKEFKGILDDLYKNQYVLVNIHDTYETKVIEGNKRYVKKQMQVPRLYGVP